MVAADKPAFPSYPGIAKGEGMEMEKTLNVQRRSQSRVFSAAWMLVDCTIAVVIHLILPDAECSQVTDLAVIVQVFRSQRVTKKQANAIATKSSSSAMKISLIFKVLTNFLRIW